MSSGVLGRLLEDLWTLQQRAKESTSTYLIQEEIDVMFEILKILTEVKE